MAQSQKEIKQKYFDKTYQNALMIKCICGCGADIKSKDHYGRNCYFVVGHAIRKYEDPTQYKREWNHRNKKARYTSKMDRYRKLKGKLILLYGGECQDCHIKYDGTNACIFQFHHRDPSNKLFSLGNQVVNKSWKRIIDEANKCDLICANCHEKRHSSKF